MACRTKVRPGLEGLIECRPTSGEPKTAARSPRAGRVNGWATHSTTWLPQLGQLYGYSQPQGPTHPCRGLSMADPYHCVSCMLP